MELAASSIVELHDDRLARPDGPAGVHAPERARVAIEDNHRYNILLWNEEDRARRTDVAAMAIAASKRLIDRYNQLRNDTIEAIDESLLQSLAHVQRHDDARLSSETAGAMIDRLSILALKVFHMRAQTARIDAGHDHVSACQAKLHRLMAQRTDLAACFGQLLADCEAGRAYFKVYRQYKMYNDPTLNPYLYGAPPPSATP